MDLNGLKLDALLTDQDDDEETLESLTTLQTFLRFLQLDQFVRRRRLEESRVHEHQHGLDRENWQRHDDRPRNLAQAFNKWSDDDWLQDVRFSKDQFEYLCQELYIPLVFPTEAQRQESSTLRKIRMLHGRLVFAMTLSRLAQATPVKGQMSRKWGYARTEITKWTNACMAWLMTISYYKGHGLKFQGIVTPCGLLEDVYGPEMGRHHDIFVWYQSKVHEEMDKLHPTLHGPRYVLYGDAAYNKYWAKPYIACAFPRRCNLTPAQLEYNAAYNKCRTAIEWAFGHVYTLWSSFRNKPLLKKGMSPIGARYLLACFSYNCKTCLNKGNQTSLFFDCDPPTLRARPRPTQDRHDHNFALYDALVEHFGEDAMPDVL